MAFLKKYALTATLALTFGAFMLMCLLHIVDLYRAGGGIAGWADGGHLATMRGWHTIEDAHPHVIRGSLPGTFYVQTDNGTFATNFSIDDDLYVLLDKRAAE